MRLFGWIFSRWHSYMRALDLGILWPICKERAGNMDIARADFALHAFNDPAWLCLGESEIIRVIDGLS